MCMYLLPAYWGFPTMTDCNSSSLDLWKRWNMLSLSRQASWELLHFFPAWPTFGGVIKGSLPPTTDAKSSAIRSYASTVYANESQQFTPSTQRSLGDLAQELSCLEIGPDRSMQRLLIEARRELRRALSRDRNVAAAQNKFETLIGCQQANMLWRRCYTQARKETRQHD